MKTEWGTDHWGDILSEPSEGHARGVARITGAKLFSRSPMGQWIEQSREDLDARESQVREAVEQ